MISKKFYSVTVHLLILAKICSGKSDTSIFIPPNDVFQTIYQWSYINFTWDSIKSYEHAIAAREYIPENVVITGLKLYKNEMYVSLPHYRIGVPVTLAKIPPGSPQHNPLLEPFPSWSAFVKNDCNMIQSVQEIEIDSHGYMWVIDGIRINNLTNCPPKLVILDLNNFGKVLHSYVFPKDISLTQGGFLNDIVIDETDGIFAYITDNSQIDPGLIVYSLQKNKAWKLRDQTMTADLGARNFIVDNHVSSSMIPIDGISLSPIPKNKKHGRFIFYSAIASYNLYAINTNILKQEKLFANNYWKKFIIFVGQREGQSDGMIIDNSGNLFYTLLPLYGVGKWNIFENIATSEIITENIETIVWPDSFAFDGNGFLYLVANHVYKYITTDITLKIEKEPQIRILATYTGTNSYLHI